MTEPQRGEDGPGEERPGRWSRARSRVAGLAGTAKVLREEVPLVGRALRQIVRVNLLDSATRLAAQAFLSALPALLAVAVFAPAAIRDGVVSSMRDQLGITGEAQKTFQQMMSAEHTDVTQSFGAVGVVVTLLSATTLSRALQRVCERCWEIPKAGTRVAAWRWLVWLLVWLVFLVLQVPVRKGFGLGVWIGYPLLLVFATLLWWWTQHLLLGSRVRWYPLLPGAVLCGGGQVLLTVAALVYLPGAVSRSVAKFGPYGVVFTSLSWLIVLFTAMTLGIALGRVVSEESAAARLLGTPTEPGRWGRREG
ncbi:YhjD/YihY/BrkB family envelope integrity protein [Kitasatospora camelliae]|uniref:YhjD/YihY/BrkB family envelope integrity protein n=1 Tax=Kitasatospora camelliae TaxID=3156397 RepID=A0AAU8JYS9_9ACTN